MKTLQHLSRYTFGAYQLALFRQLGEYKGRQLAITRQQPEVLDTLRQVAILESVEKSSLLDGIEVSKEQVKQLVNQSLIDNDCLTSCRCRLMDKLFQQVAGYRDALEVVVEPGEHMNLSVGLIQQLHATLYARISHEGGRFRVTNKQIVERDSKGHKIGVLYRTVRASAIPDAMESLVAHYHQGLQQQMEPLLLIPAVILDLLCIHPFSDGNARIAWLIVPMLLALNGYQAAQLISLERIVYQNEQSYQRALRLSVKGWHEGTHNPMPWIDFFLNTLLHAYIELEDKTYALHSQAPKSQLVKAAIEQTQQAFSIADICRQIPSVSRELVKKIVQKMRAEGLLELVGRGRGAQWQKCS